ncbi:MAG: thiamine pyrophosphate-dependent enzyme [Candidatus Bathyarchaeia archaeon]
MNPLVKYLRTEMLPTIFCPGCGNGLILRCTVQALAELETFENMAFVSGIVCSAYIPTYIHADVAHTVHGRTLPVATGMKLAKPSLKLVVFTGDGDNLSIGGNHFIHAARRNIELTVIMVNNRIYGMTGGQVSPTTPMEAKTPTTPFGGYEPPFDACKLAKHAGATFIARWAVTQPVNLKNSIKKALMHKGFSFIEVLSTCPTYMGRYVEGAATPIETFLNLRKQTVQVESLDTAVQNDTIPVGEFQNIQAPTLGDRLLRLNIAKGEKH